MDSLDQFQVPELCLVFDLWELILVLYGHCLQELVGIVLMAIRFDIRFKVL